MLKKIKNKIKQKTILNMGIVFLGNIISSFLNFIFIIYLARKLGVKEFGKFNWVVEMIALFTSFTDLGVTTGFIRYYSLYLKEDVEKSKILVKLTFLFKLGISALLFIGLNVFCEVFVVDVAMAYLLRIASFGILTITLYGYFCTLLQSNEEFKKYVIAKLVGPVLKAAALFFLVVFNRVNIKGVVVLFYAAPLMGAIVAFKLSHYKFSKSNLKGKIVKEVGKELFHFSKWVTISSFAVTFMTRLDILMLNSLSSDVEMGYYSGGQKLALILPLVTGTMTTVLLPKVSRLEERVDIERYLKNSFKMSTLIVIPLFVCILFSKFLVVLVLGKEYYNSIAIFRMLLISYVFGVFVNPVSLLMYNFNKTKLLAVMNCLQLIINFLGNYFLIPVYGAKGATFSTLIVRIIGSFYIIFSVFIILKKRFNYAKKDL